MQLGLIFIILLVAHAIADGPLQPAALSVGKRSVDWLTRWRSLAAHASIHGALVHLATGVWWLFFAELVAHAAIDWMKARKLFGVEVDQMLHVMCKMLWVVLIA